MMSSEPCAHWEGSEALVLSFEIPASRLTEPLQLVLRATATRDLVPALTGILIEAHDDQLSLTGTDFDLGLRMSVDAKVTSPGRALIPARSLAELARRIPPASLVEVKAVEGKATMRFGKSRFDLPTLIDTDYPSVDFGADSQSEGKTLKAAALRHVLGRVTYAAAQRDDSLPILLGIKVSFSSDGHLEVCASDNFRLAWAQTTTEAVGLNAEVVVKARALTEMVRSLPDEDVRVALSERQMFFRSGSVQGFCQRVEGQFPDHRKLIKETYETTIQVQVADVIQAGERASLATDVRSPQVILRAGEDGVSLSAESAEMGSAYEDIPATWSGAPVEIAFNPKFLIDALKNAGAEAVDIGFNGPLSAARLHPTGAPDDHLALVLPIRRM